jgi:hypothetical protein
MADVRQPGTMSTRPSKDTYHVLNLGAGVQSTALYLMFMQGILKPQLDAAIFADPQEESELTYAHLEWLKCLGGPRIITRTKGKLGDHLIQGCNSTGQRFTAIPAFTTDGVLVSKTKRQCTKEYKLEVIGQALRQDVLGLRSGQHVSSGILVHVYIGFSLNESGRAWRLQRDNKCAKYIQRHFPLIERHITRNQCSAWLRTQVPHEVPRSACVFCPFHNDAEWIEIQKNPHDWARAVEIDRALRTTGSVANRKMNETMYLHRSCQPIEFVELKPVMDPRAAQSDLNFAGECLGMCGY